jgi:hypothetical protein|uniref:Uncharacterized protein n=1 Tax=Podoviridae sp. ctWeH21 TaxID=2825255 RepID=A0A8S5PGS6_9CAUD|nr:MAG TPA: hypothetical protein [Podoviridae sp. ctWeH21]
MCFVSVSDQRISRYMGFGACPQHDEETFTFTTYLAPSDTHFVVGHSTHTKYMSVWMPIIILNTQKTLRLFSLPVICDERKFLMWKITFSF